MKGRYIVHMVKKNNKQCIVCGTKYTYCPNCSDYANMPHWMGWFHNSNCRKIFYITSGYCNKTITKEEANKQFNECDLSRKDNFKKNIYDVISEVLNKDLVENKLEEMAVKNNLEDTNVNENSKENDKKDEEHIAIKNKNSSIQHSYSYKKKRNIVNDNN